MLKNKFNPLDKTFLFQFGKDNCFYCNSGYCIIDKHSHDEIERYEVKKNLSIAYEPEYCLWFANTILHGRMTEIANIYHYTKCNHHVFSGGQHRTCVYARLLKKGFDVSLPAEYYIINNNCRYCCDIDKELKKTPDLIIPFLNNIKHDRVVKKVYAKNEIVKFDF